MSGGQNNVLIAMVDKAIQRTSRFQSPEWATVMGTALLVGFGAGFGAVIFHLLIKGSQWLFFDAGARVFGFIGDYYVLVIPILGGLIGGPLVVFFAREAKGHGVPEVMEAVALRGGRIRPRVAVVKSLASSICIGSGGSVGSEGPIVQIGAALGSTVGQVLRLSDERMRSLVACGAAGGIAAVFNAPIAGTIFALEVILGQFQSMYFGAVVISAVLADVVVHIFEGSHRAFAVPAYELHSPAELLLYAVMGVLAAGVAVFYSYTIDRMEGVFEGWKQIPDHFKAAVGGLLVGILGVLAIMLGGELTFTWSNGHPMPAMFGIGYEVVNIALLGQLGIGASLLLLVSKLLATGFTLGSGGSGGIFAPGLFIGAMLGSAFGQVVNSVFPGQVGPAGAYALVGMAAVFAGTAHAPATAILILFEMTGDYNIILPLMFATVVSLIISRAIQPLSIYTMKLARRGVRLQYGRDVDLMEGVTVSEAMTLESDTVSPDLTAEELIAEFERTNHHGFPVVDKDGRLTGIVTLTDLNHALDSRGSAGWMVADIATHDDIAVAEPQESLATAMLRMGVRGVGRLPVVADRASMRYVGVLRRDNLIGAYNRAIARRTRISDRLRTLQRLSADNVNVFEVRVTEGMACSGLELKTLVAGLPEDFIIASIMRGTRILIPHGDTVIQPGDNLTIITGREQTQAVLHMFSEEGA